MLNPQPTRSIAIACGGTGGHFFPGLAVAAQMLQHGWSVSLMVSPKDVDQQAAQMTAGMDVVTLPAVALNRGGRIAFLHGFVQSYRMAHTCFVRRRPDAVLAMGGFTSAPPILAARRTRARTFLHESNTIPGRANRWLARLVTEAFVGFPEAAERLRCHKTTIIGTPVRPEFHPRDAGECRTALGLDPRRPVLLVTGGSQGASGINDLMIVVLPALEKALPDLQWLHLTGARDAERVSAEYAKLGLRAVVKSFCGEMHLALGAATAALSRAGASSLAELAAARVPAILVPYPTAADNHQFHNARAFEKTGAARLLEQGSATAATLVQLIREVVGATDVRERMRAALARWHAPRAAEDIAEAIVKALPAGSTKVGGKAATASAPIHRHLSAIT